MTPTPAGASAPAPADTICSCGHPALNHHGVDREEGCFGWSLVEPCDCVALCPEVMATPWALGTALAAHARDRGFRAVEDRAKVAESELARLRLSADYTPEGVDIVMAELREARTRRPESVVKAEALRELADELQASKPLHVVGGIIGYTALRSRADRIEAGQ